MLRSTVSDHCRTTIDMVRLRSSGGNVSKFLRNGVLLSPASSTRPPSDSSCASLGKLEPQRCIASSDSAMPLQDEISTSKAASTLAPYSTNRLSAARSSTALARSAARASCSRRLR